MRQQNIGILNSIVSILKTGKSFAIFSVFLMFNSMLSIAEAQPCPKLGTPIEKVRSLVNVMGANDRAPAAADCSAIWASGSNLNQESLNDRNLVIFFIDAADLHRMAYEKRKSQGEIYVANKYLKVEISIRRKFLGAAHDLDPDKASDVLKNAITRHTSDLTGALMRAGQFEEVNNLLADTNPVFINETAANHWLKSVWSCPKFDGASSSFCKDNVRELCRDRVETFFESIDGIRNPRFPPQVLRDIIRFRSQVKERAC